MKKKNTKICMGCFYIEYFTLDQCCYDTNFIDTIHLVASEDEAYLYTLEEAEAICDLLNQFGVVFYSDTNLGEEDEN